jgi:uncharacterized membrane protein (DUF485 family)
MGGETELLKDPEFQRLLVRRSRWRWGLSGLLIGAYLVWGIGGIYFAEAYAAPFMGIALPWGMAVGFLIIAMSIVLSMVYVRVVNRLEAEEAHEQDKHR